MNLKTGTTIVCVVGKDAIILGSDKQMTYGPMKYGETEKIYILKKNILIGGAGSVSAIQMVENSIDKILRYFEKSGYCTGSNCEKMILNYLAYELKKSGGAPLAIFFCWRKNEKLFAYHLDGDGTMLEVKTYDVIGSGTPYASSVLSVDFVKNLKEKELIALAKKSVLSSINKDLYSGLGSEYVLLSKENLLEIKTF